LSDSFWTDLVRIAQESFIRCCELLLAAAWRLLGSIVLLPVVVDASDLAVFYPDVRAPYIRVFDDIILGIKKGYGGDIEVYVLSNYSKTEDLEKWLHERTLHKIVALGNQAMNLALELPDEPFNTVAGAVLSAPEIDDDRAFAAITMVPDPELLFKQLKELSPAIQTVSVVYQAGRHDSLISRARDAANLQSLKLVYYSTDNARDGANLYKDIIDNHSPGVSAIWLLQGVPALEERSVLQLVLREAWNKKILVFSSNPSYVKKGALFSLYPDNVALGRRLANAVSEQEKGARLGSIPSRDLLSVLNTRTAEHLGLKLSRSRRRQFDIVFPSE
jgi:putative ABC transport system substrate-binding protein